VKSNLLHYKNTPYFISTKKKYFGTTALFLKAAGALGTVREDCVRIV
jgi:hypothetical protein